jgi:nicotinate-nucleotide pyrophosphorylase (carboxylating)
MRSKLVLEFWDRKSFFKTEEYYSYVKNLINKKIKEDLGGGDITTDSLIDKNKEIKAVIIAREDGIVAGIEEISLILEKEEVTALKKDGDVVKNGDTILSINGNARKILAYERTLLNILQRMSGIATLTYNTRKLVNNNCFIAGTRKTLLSLLDKKAISIGGALTHRLNLNDSILIKDNHLNILDNNIEKALELAVKNAEIKYMEIEVKNEEEALKSAEVISNLSSEKLFAIMFDNMKATMIKRTIDKIYNIKKIKNNEKLNARKSSISGTNSVGNKILFETSGGIDNENIAEYSKTGVDIISLGFLTHSPKAFNFSMEIK